MGQNSLSAVGVLFLDRLLVRVHCRIEQQQETTVPEKPLKICLVSSELTPLA